MGTMDEDQQQSGAGTKMEEASEGRRGTRSDTDSEDELEEKSRYSKDESDDEVDEKDDVEILVTKPEDDGEEDEDEVYELSRTPSPVDMMDDTPMMRKKSAPHNVSRAQRSPNPDQRSPSPVARRSPSPVDRRSPSPVRRSPSPVKRSPSPVERSLSPVEARSPSPVQERERTPSPERKDSRGSHGSSSYDEERASSLSPEPPKAILAPNKVTSPMSPPPSQSNRAALTKIYTEALGDSDSEERREKVVRNKPAGDITAMYTQKLVEKEELASSPKPERKEMMFQRPEGMTNITQLYTAALKEENRESGGKVKPMRNGNITKLYTEGLDKEPERAFKGKPKDEKTNPIKHNLATRVDKAAIVEAYNDVMADNNNIEWAAFTFSDNKLGVAAKGVDFAEFKSHFGADDRGFGYIKITTGDEMSKRSKFVFCTWVGPNVSVMKKAKMSTDKALLKDIITNLSVELLVETAGEFTLEHFKTEVDKAGGARYGTGVREM